MNATRPAPSAPARGDEDRGRRYDPSQRLAAAHLAHRSPHWLILWGTHSRRFFAFPLFHAPRGTIVTAPDTTALTARMRQAEAGLAARPHPSAVKPG